MQRSKRIRVTILALVVVAIGALSGAPGALAASGIGPSAPARVTCNNIAHQLLIQPNFGAGDAYAKQNISYRIKYYKYDPYAKSWGKPLYPTIDGQYWKTFMHERMYWFYNEAIWTWQQAIETWASAPSPTLNVSAGQYYVYIQYAWEIGAGQWFDRTGSRLSENSPWEGSNFLWPGLHGFQTYCIV